MTNLRVLSGATGHDRRFLSTRATLMEPLACVVMAGAEVRLTAHGQPPSHRCCCCWTSRGCGPCSLRARRPRPPDSISRPICSTSSLYAHTTAAAQPSTGASAVTVSVSASVLPDDARSALHDRPRSSSASIGMNKPRYTSLQPPTDLLTPLGNVVVALDLYNIRDRGCVVGAVCRYEQY
ncbi:unnamed protein product [Macrosiphum euphorbiae]|uniref:Uncharacterized protein n=1 Tax=Macrosiphum euphorbiae TaxID=13131 RepID=A0AAV0Y1G8_9HEMI|nr:unnamed protein product [Macrosiphum euphorbiae]